MITVSPTFSFHNDAKARYVALWLRENGYKAQSDKILNAISYQHGGFVTPDPDPEPTPIDCDHRVFVVHRLFEVNNSTYVGTTELKGMEKQLAEVLRVGETVKFEAGTKNFTITRSR